MNKPILCHSECPTPLARDEVSLIAIMQATPLELTCTPMPVTEEQTTATSKESCRKHTKKEKERARNLEEELAALKARKKNREKEPTTRTPSTTGYNLDAAATNSQVDVPFTPQQKMIRHDATNTCCTSKDVSFVEGKMIGRRLSRGAPSSINCSLRRSDGAIYEMCPSLFNLLTFIR